MRTPALRAFTLIELLVVITIICVLVALLLPAVQSAREAARQAQCSNNLKQIGLALHNYVQNLNSFPPGCVVLESEYPGFDPWTEASDTKKSAGKHGTSWMLMVLPYIERANIYDAWNFKANVMSNAALAQTNISEFYCPSRRKKIRRADKKRLLDDQWTGGGTDYGGCLGAGNGWVNTDEHRFAKPQKSPPAPPEAALEFWDLAVNVGILSPNSATDVAEVRDGMSNTILLGELQRLDGSVGQLTSQDGWALGGVATLFTTAMKEEQGRPNGYQKGGINGAFFENAGSDHPGGAYFGMADGSVQFLNDMIDHELFYHLGAMADKHVAQVPQ